MSAKPLNRLSFYKLNREIDKCTIEMYHDITKCLLYDASPLDLATKVFDTWEMMAQTIYENDLITHKQCILAVMRIARTVDQMLDALGVTPFDDMQ